MTIRIVFVDDEPRVLDGLRLGLRSKRKVWDMSFVEGGKGAIEQLEAFRVDVVVSDMRMPGMDGAELLGRVAVLRPEAVRIILSGQMDESAAVRAASVAHRFLTKPCDSRTLEATITQAIELHQWLGSDRLRSCVGSLETLPSLPQAYLALNRALADAEVSVGAVARIIEDDPGMAAKVLQLVNSSFFGLSRSMVNVGQAVSYLGIGTMKSLVLAESLFHKFGNADPTRVEREKERSLLRARVARKLFDDPLRADAAATAALLLDVGSLALLSRMPADHAVNLTVAAERRIPVHEVERERLGVTHAEVGAYLLGLWGLPHEIIDAVARHHDPWRDGEGLDTGTAVRVANVLTSELLMQNGVLPAAALPEGLLRRFGIATVIERMRSEIPASLQRG